jgi:flagellar motility protein MotE (MotC chaperone)
MTMISLVRGALFWGYVVIAIGGVASIWFAPFLSPTTTGVTRAVAAEQPAAPAKPAEKPAAKPEPAGAAPAARPATEPPTRPQPALESARKLFPPGQPFDPLDLTPDKVALLEQAYKVVLAAREHDAAVTARESALKAARTELEQRLALFEEEVRKAREAYRQQVDADMAGRAQALDAKEKALKAQEESLSKLKTRLRQEIADDNKKIAAVYQNMKPKKAAEVLAQQDPVDAATIVFMLPDDQRTKILSEMDPALAGAILAGPFAADLAALRKGGAARGETSRQ